MRRSSNNKKHFVLLKFLMFLAVVKQREHVEGVNGPGCASVEKTRKKHVKLIWSEMATTELLKGHFICVAVMNPCFASDVPQLWKW